MVVDFAREGQRKGGFPSPFSNTWMRAYAHAPYNSKSGPFEWLGYSIEFLVARNTDGDEVSVKFSLHPQYKFTFLRLLGNYVVIMM